MGLRVLGRVVKTSTVIIEVISAVILTLWIVLFIQDGSEAECPFEQDGCLGEAATIAPPCVEPSLSEQWEMVAVFTYGIFIASLSIGDQVVLLYIADHRWIRRIQLFILYAVVLTFISICATVYIGMALQDLQIIALLVSLLVPRTVQLILLLKFLNALISSSPSVSIVATTTV